MGTYGDTLGTRWGRIGDALKMLWGRIGDALKILWGRIGDALGTLGLPDISPDQPVDLQLPIDRTSGTHNGKSQ